ncbi:hypothetical protein ACWD4V_01185 [Streptomyces tsukubensis]
MFTLKFRLAEVIDIATHTILAPASGLRATFEQQTTGAPLLPALWWVRDGNGTYLTGNDTATGGPCDAFAKGYGPGENDASGILGGSSQVIASFPLWDTAGGENLYDVLLRAQGDGHDTLTITAGDAAPELRTLSTPGPDVPQGLTAFTRGIARRAAAKDLCLTWEVGPVWHFLHLAPRGPHGVTGRVEVSASTGGVYRAALVIPLEDGVTERRTWGTKTLRALIDSLSPSPCEPGCTAPSPLACYRRARKR